MQFVTWLWEIIPVAAVDNEVEPRLPENMRQRRRLSILLTAILAVACCIAPMIWIASRTPGTIDAFWNVVFVFIGEVIYLFLARYLILEPDMENLGWYGGLMNDPFQIADNHNRIILFFKSILLPGRMIYIGLVDFTQIFNVH